MHPRRIRPALARLARSDAAGRTALAAAAVLGALAAGRLLRHALVHVGPSTVPVVRFAGAARPFVLFVFQPSDCPGHAGLFAGWSALHRSGELAVVGVMLDAPRDSAARRRALAALDVAFPVRHDLGGRATRALLRMGFDRTPVAVLFDARGRPRLLIPAPPDPRAGRHALRLAREYARELLAGPEPAGPAPSAGARPPPRPGPGASGP